MTQKMKEAYKTKVMVDIARKNDIDRIVDFQLAMAKESEGLDLESSVVKKGVGKVIEYPYLGTYFLAYDIDNPEDGPIGSMMITTEWSDWNNAEYYWLQSVYVKPEYRRRGVFTQMVKWLEKNVKYKDVKSLRLYVDKGNEAAKKCYKKLGISHCHYNMYEKVLK